MDREFHFSSSSEIDANFGFCGLFINQIKEKDLIFSSGFVRNDDGFGGF